jgi:two-component system, LytTR family, response regulator
MPIRTVIANRDTCFGQILHAVLDPDPEVNVIAECSTGRQLTPALSEHCPSLLLLDVQLPDLDCLTLVKALGTESLVSTIFLVPPGDYAVQAFEGRAFGYLVKPTTPSRLLQALSEAKADIERQLLGNDLGHLSRLSGVRSNFASQDRILVKAEGRFVFLRSQEIDWIQAKANYVCIHAGGVSYLCRQTITSMERDLDGTRFLRIHRSTIVNIDKIRELRPWPTGEYVVFMRCGKELTLSRSYRSRLPLFIGEADPVGKARRNQLFSPLGGFSSDWGHAQAKTMTNREIGIANECGSGVEARGRGSSGETRLALSRRADARMRWI